MTTPLPEDSSFEDILAAWQSAADDFVELVTPLAQEEWDAPTALPGWTVGDVVAHVGWIEGILLGQMDPPHEPDWDALPHVRNDFGRITEIPVDLRRRWPREDVLIELADVMSRRATSLREGPQDASLEVVGPLGVAPLGRVVQMRAMDTWVHEQDIRAALGRPGHLDAPGARATAAQLLPGLAKIWVKGAGAQPGQALRVSVTGPELTAERTVIVGDDGRARAAGPEEEPTTTLTMDWSTYLALACGRGDHAQWRARVEVEGDAGLGERTLQAFTVMI